MSGIDPNRAGVIVVGGGGSLPTASGAGEIPVSSGAGTTYTATGAFGLLVPVDSNDQVRLLLTETSSTYANSGAAGGTWSDGGGTTRGIAPLLTGGVLCSDGATAYLEGSSSVAPASLTLWAWVRRLGANGAAGAQLILGRSRNASPTWSDPYWSVGLLLQSSGAPRATVSASGAGTNVELNAGAAYAITAEADHLVGMTYDGTTLRLWLDGAQIASSTPSLVIGYGASVPWRIGVIWSGSGDRLNGRVHAAGICDTVRAAAWWQEMHRRGRGTYR